MNHSLARLSLCCLLFAPLLACDSEAEEETPGGGNDKPMMGVWNRFGSEYGYQTDVAFGGIEGQSSDRVYMCELPGSPSAGLYKGRLISPRMIRWDPTYGLPDYEVVFEGSTMRFRPQNGTNTFLGQYQKGTWTPGACDLALENGELVDKSATAYVLFQNGPDFRINNVTVGGEPLPIHATETCSVTTLIPPGTSDGTLNVTISYSGVGVDGPYSRTQNHTLRRSDFKPGCNKLVAEVGCGALAVCVAVIP